MRLAIPPSEGDSLTPSGQRRKGKGELTRCIYRNAKRNVNVTFNNPRTSLTNASARD